MATALIPLLPSEHIDLDALVPLVRELVSWLGDDAWPPGLAAVVRAAPAGTLDDLHGGVPEGAAVAVAWNLEGLVRHALLPLAELSMIDGQPMIPELGAALLEVLADPRLGPGLYEAVELALLDSEDLEGQLEAEARGQ